MTSLPDSLYQRSERINVLLKQEESLQPVASDVVFRSHDSIPLSPSNLNVPHLLKSYGMPVDLCGGEVRQIGVGFMIYAAED